MQNIIPSFKYIFVEEIIAEKLSIINQKTIINQKSIIMKNLIFTIGTLCLTVVNVVNAGNADPKKETAMNYYNNIETTLMFPDEVLSAKAKTTIELIAQDNQITEQSTTINDELQAAKKTIEQIIAENNQIIDNTAQDEVYTLNLN